MWTPLGHFGHTQGSEKVHQWRILSNFKARVENGEDFTLDDLQKALDDIKSLPPPPKAIERSFSLDDPVRFLEMEEELPSVDRAAFGAPPAPKMAMEALMQRQDRYKQDQEKAKGNPSNPTPPRPLPMSQNQKQLDLLEKARGSGSSSRQLLWTPKKKSEGGQGVSLSVKRI